MSIRPIDMQVMINNTADVNKIGEYNLHKGEQQLMFSQQMEKEVEKNNERTVEAHKSEDEKIKDGQEGNKGKYKSRKRENHNHDEQNQIEKDNVKKGKSSSLFDVSI